MAWSLKPGCLNDEWWLKHSISEPTGTLGDKMMVGMILENGILRRRGGRESNVSSFNQTSEILLVQTSQLTEISRSLCQMVLFQLILFLLICDAFMKLIVLNRIEPLSYSHSFASFSLFFVSNEFYRWIHLTNFAKSLYWHDLKQIGKYKWVVEWVYEFHNRSE